ncbi:NIL domain-containing protein [Phosphitispora sp. TUW77]|uniref:NIL domain-containing protein n=1 Tax=Phosphitispora sp. TUW77 TaxID=3152361 RepID=UPI003AB17F95
MSPKKIILKFPSGIVEKPLIYHLVKDYDLMVNIIKANVNPNKEGSMVMELIGDSPSYDQGLDFLRSQGVLVDYLNEGIVRNIDRCTHCGACTSICPSGALYISRPSMEVIFEDDKCVICGVCLKTCPVRALEPSVNGGNGGNGKQ